MTLGSWANLVVFALLFYFVDGRVEEGMKAFENTFSFCFHLVTKEYCMMSFTSHSFIYVYIIIYTLLRLQIPTSVLEIATPNAQEQMMHSTTTQ